MSKSQNKDEIIKHLETLTSSNVEDLSNTLSSAIQVVKRKESIKSFENMLSGDFPEKAWQKWFQDNNWVFGTEYVKVLNERSIDTKNITDFLVKSHDGFVDIIEIKRPHQALPFWATRKDHENMIPSSDLVKAIIQSANYIYELEMEANSKKFSEKIEHSKVIKPRCILIFGRSDGWTPEHYKSYRILNSSYHNITILTYDHVLSRAKNVLGIEEDW